MSCLKPPDRDNQLMPDDIPTDLPAGRVTMADLAREAGVAPITISRALSGHPLVRAATRERIRTLAAARGYQLNVAARNLRTQRTRTIAAVVEMTPTPMRPISDSYPLGLLGGIMQELAGVGYSVMLSTAETFVGTVPAVDGVILLGQGVHDDAVATIARAGLPMTVWGSARNDRDHVIVGSDNVAGGALAAQRLLALGRRRLAFLGDIEHAEIADRFDGFAGRLADEGTILVERRACDFTFAGGYDATVSMIDDGSVIDGVFGCSDAIAMGAVRALAERGRSVPGEVAVVGFDGTSAATHFVPSLTTIRQNWHEAGRLLARKTLAMIEGGQARSETLAVSLAIGAS